MSKSLNYSEKNIGGSAEVCVPLKGEVSADAPNHPQPGLGRIDEALWLDPDRAYDGPVDHDLSNTPLSSLAHFWSDAIHTTREEMRLRWKVNRYPDLPGLLARDLIEDCEAVRMEG